VIFPRKKEREKNFQIFFDLTLQVKGPTVKTLFKKLPSQFARNYPSFEENSKITEMRFRTGLPDFSWYMIPKPEYNVPNEYKMYQIS
jgi:hypothetical protein